LLNPIADDKMKSVRGEIGCEAPRAAAGGYFPQTVHLPESGLCARMRAMTPTLHISERDIDE
jgi:hypothetical protein